MAIELNMFKHVLGTRLLLAQLALSHSVEELSLFGSFQRCQSPAHGIANVKQAARFVWKVSNLLNENNRHSVERITYAQQHQMFRQGSHPNIAEV